MVLIPHIFVIFAHQNIILDRFTTDDAFYYFKTAQNVVEGQGFTFDGIARTNGFHPLWMALLLPIFTLARYDLILPLRLVFALQLLLGLGSALFLYQLIRTRCSQWTAFVTACMWIFTDSIYNVIYKGGTEASVNAFFLVLLWWLFYHVSEKIFQGDIHIWQIAALGVIASLTLLSRLDNVFLVFIVGGWLMIRFWRQPGSASHEWVSSIKWWLKLGFSYFTPLVTTLSLYMMMNQLYFGSFLPVSGKVKRWWGTLNFTVYGKPPQNLGDFFNEFFSTQNSIGPWAVIMSPVNNIRVWYQDLSVGTKVWVGILVIILLGLIIYLIFRNLRFVGIVIWRWNLIALMGGCLVQILYYKTSGHVAQKVWYWTAEMLLVILLFGLVFEIITRGISILPQGSKLIAVSAVIITLVLALPYLNIPYQVIKYTPSDEEHYYLRRANWLADNTEIDSLIGMTGSGSTGYLVVDRVVVNLDGLISSQAYFEHLQNATADQYLESIGLDYVFGDETILQRSNPYQWNFDNRLELFRTFERDEKTLTLFKFKIQ